MKEVKVYNLSGMPCAPLEDFHELQEDFKIYNPELNEKLQNLILERGFKYAFKAWKDEDGKLWIIDAHQRKAALLELQKKGYKIPPIPYELIFAENKRDAVKEIAAYNSEFAKKNQETELFKKYEIGTDELEKFNLEMKPIDLNLEKSNDIDWDELGKIPDPQQTDDSESNYRIKYEILFDNEGQQQHFYEFIGKLKGIYPKCETIASRLMQFIEDHE